MMGNDDLKAETSINKEIGLEFKRDGWLAGYLVPQRLPQQD
jgi:ferric enterobactin receptor